MLKRIVLSSAAFLVVIGCSYEDRDSQRGGQEKDPIPLTATSPTSSTSTSSGSGSTMTSTTGSTATSTDPCGSIDVGTAKGTCSADGQLGLFGLTASTCCQRYANGHLTYDSNAACVYECFSKKIYYYGKTSP